VAALCALALAIGLLAHVPVWIWRAGALLWLVGGALALRAGPLVWPRINKPMRMLLGIVGLTLAWLALVSAHALGVNFLMSLLCLVWMADIAAYFGGRRFGRRKLALSISPGKSWEGAWSGLAGVLVLALLWLAVDRQSSLDSASLFTLLMQRFGPAGMLASVFLLVGFSVVGDLFESLVKRAAGVKDSSGLLPGHGGVLDRVDALLPVLPLAMALITL
jgi:phosphatidate cytidylyltransferase